MHHVTRQKLWNMFRQGKDFIYNLSYFTDHSPASSELAYIRNCVLSLPSAMRANFAKECEFVANLPLDQLHRMLIPYSPRGITPDDVAVGRNKGMPFVEHGRAGKLYFPRWMSEEEAKNAYLDLVNIENIIGHGSSPHSYQDTEHCLEGGGVLLDVGSAEGLFAFDNMDKVSKAYLFEGDSAWYKPLRLTFLPYADKAVIVNKTVADKTTRHSTKLIDAVKGDVNDKACFFVKMDIEGRERTVIKSNKDFFTSAKVKLSCCVYHRQDDAQVIEEMLKSYGYKTRFSAGYMLSTMNGIHYPYFRHGVIYAQNY